MLQKPIDVTAFCPTHIDKHFYCHNNDLTSLQYCPSTVGDEFDCSRNQPTSLQHCPHTVGGEFRCLNNPLVVTQENEREWMEVIKKYKNVYADIEKPTEHLTNFYKLLHEL